MLPNFGPPTDEDSGVYVEDAEHERRRREDRGSVGAEGGGVRGGDFPLPVGGIWGGACPCPENVRVFHNKRVL